MIVYLHSPDVPDAGRTFERHKDLTDVIHIIINENYSVPQIVQEVIRRVRQPRSIWLLIFNAHGNSGTIHLGRGIGILNVTELSPLAPYMTLGGKGVEIHSCLVASSVTSSEANAGHSGEYDIHRDPAVDRVDLIRTTPGMTNLGMTFIEYMAASLNVPIRGGMDYQIGQQTATFGGSIGDTEGVFEGPWVTVWPNGAATQHDPSQAPH